MIDLEWIIYCICSDINYAMSIWRLLNIHLLYELD